jgi:hypothetical protein
MSAKCKRKSLAQRVHHHTLQLDNWKLGTTRNAPQIKPWYIYILAQVLPHPQLIFPSKPWFLGIYLNFQPAEIT